MSQVLAGLAGLLFGFGLSLSGMTAPARVQGFLDLAGVWDPTLAFVMGGALLVNLPAYWLTRRRAAPLFGVRFQLPSRRDLDGRLLAGSALFGIGWGLAGLCPGPALASLSQGAPLLAGFVVAMVGGMLLAERWNQTVAPVVPRS